MIHTFKFNENSTYDKNFVATINENASLRKTDSSFDYTREGTYKSSTIETAELFASGIQSFIGIAIVCDEPTGTSIRFQLSVDGTNWLYWDSAAWVTAGTNVNTDIELSAGILNLQFVPGNQKRLKFKVFLNANTEQNQTPQITYIYVYTNIEMSFYEDACRSVHSYILNNYSTLLNTTFQAIATGTTFTFTPTYNVKDVIGVYNYSTDQYRIQSLLSTWSDTGNNIIQVNLSSSITSGEIIWIDYKGIPSHVEIVFPDPLIVISELPAISIAPVNSNIKHRFFYTQDQVHYDALNEDYYIGKHPQLTEISFDIEFMSNNNRESLQMLEDAYDDFDMRKRIPSLASGEDYIVITFVPLIISDNLRQEVSSKKIRVLLSGKKIFRTLKQVKRLEQISLTLGDNNTIADTTTIT